VTAGMPTGTRGDRRVSTYAIAGLTCGVLSWVPVHIFPLFMVSLVVLPIASVVWMGFTVADVWLSGGRRCGTGFAIGGMLLGVVRVVTISMGGH